MAPPVLSRRNWLFLLASACIIAPLSLAVHDIMLTRLHVPYPHTVAMPIWASYLDNVVRLVSFAWLCRAAAREASNISIQRTVLFGGLALLMLNETTRVFVIEVFLTKGGLSQGGWVFTLISKLPVALTWFTYGAVTALLSLRMRRGTTFQLTLFVVAAFGLLVLQPGLGYLSGMALHELASFDLPAQYSMPFPLKIYVVIYATFIEPTIAAMAMAALVWPSLRGNTRARVVAFTVLLLLVRGRITSFLLFSFWVNQPPVIAFLSESQFFLETLVLGALSAIAWDRTRQAMTAVPL